MLTRLQAKNLCVVSLITEGYKISVHKDFLSAASPFFGKMFNSSMLEASSKEINLPGISYTVLTHVVNYMYTKEVNLTTENAQDILLAADFFQMTDLIDRCAEFIVKQIDVQNCWSMGKLFMAINCDKMIAKVFDFIKSNFKQVVQTDEFEQLCIDDVTRLLSDNDLCCESEEEVYYAAVKWLKARQDRKVHTLRILKCIRFSLLSENFNACLLIFHNYNLFNYELSSDIINSSSHISRNFNKSMLSISRQPIGNNREKYSVRLYDGVTDKWRVHTETKDRACALRVSSDCHYVFVKFRPKIGPSGFDFFKVFNLHTEQWKKLPRIPDDVRNIYEIVAVGNKLYTFSTGRITIFDMSTYCWINGPEFDVHYEYVPMIVALGKFIYVFEGCAKTGEPISRKLNTETLTWSNVKSMIHERNYCSLTTYNGKIYAGGGKTRDCGVSRCFEVYDPIRDEWKELSPLLMISYWPKLVGTSDRLYAVGGNERPGKAVVEYYDEEQDKWFSVGDRYPFMGSAGDPVCAVQSSFFH